MSTDIVDGLLTAAGFEGVSGQPQRSSFLSLTAPLQTIIAPSPKSGLINGEGVFNCTLAPLLSKCQQKSPLEFIFPPGKRIRLRLVNAGTHAMFRVSVDNHMLAVIEADDTPVNGPSVHRVPIVSRWCRRGLRRTLILHSPSLWRSATPLYWILGMTSRGTLTIYAPRSTRWPSLVLCDGVSTDPSTPAGIALRPTSRILIPTSRR